MSGIKGPCLNLDLHYFAHAKTKRLVGLLGRGAEILPIRLWCDRGVHRAEDGRFTGYSAQEIEAIAGWWGPKGQAMKALVKVGFLEREGENLWKCHDWEGHEGHLVAFREKARHAAHIRWAKERAQNDAPSMLQACSKQCPISTISTNRTPFNSPFGGYQWKTCG